MVAPPSWRTPTGRRRSSRVVLDAVAEAVRPRAAPVHRSYPVAGMGEVRPGDDLGRSAGRCRSAGRLRDGWDVVVVTQKVVSKAEGRIVAVDPRRPRGQAGPGRGGVGPGPPAAGRAAHHRDPPRVRLRQRRRRPVQRRRRYRRPPARRPRPVGPPDPRRPPPPPRVDVGVIVSDTFGRTWRQGVTDVAIGIAGVAGVVDLRGTRGRQRTGPRGRPRCAWPTSWPARPSSSWARRGAYPPPSCGAWTPRGSGRRRSPTEIVRPPAEDLFR